jgi:hypothetical protein
LHELRRTKQNEEIRRQRFGLSAAMPVHRARARRGTCWSLAEKLDSFWADRAGIQQIRNWAAREIAA